MTLKNIKEAKEIMKIINMMFKVNPKWAYKSLEYPSYNKYEKYLKG